MVIYLSLLVAIIGALVYRFNTNPKWAELGRWSYVVGLLVFLLGSGEALSLLIQKR